MWVERLPDPSAEAPLGKRFERFRRIAARAASDGAARPAYLEGKLLARAGDHRKAAEKFREVLDLDGERPEPYDLGDDPRGTGRGLGRPDQPP